MPPSKTTRSSRYGEQLLGMNPSEIRILLLVHLCLDKETGKVDFERLAARADITPNSARTMHRAALQKLARVNPEPTPGSSNGGGAGLSSTADAPVRKRRGRPRKSQTASADPATQPQTAAEQVTVPQATAAPNTGADAMVIPAMVFGSLPGMQIEEEGSDMEINEEGSDIEEDEMF